MTDTERCEWLKNLKVGDAVAISNTTRTGDAWYSRDVVTKITPTGKIRLSKYTLDRSMTICPFTVEVVDKILRQTKINRVWRVVRIDDAIDRVKLGKASNDELDAIWTALRPFVTGG